MKVDFMYSTDFLAMNAPELSHTCMHLLCTAGEGSFVFNERCYHIVKNDLVVIPYPDRVSNLAAHTNMQVEWFAADYKFLQNLLPSNNYGIGGSISLNHDPVIKLTDKQASLLLADFHRLRDRMCDRHLVFYRELMGSLCLTMMYDIFEPHAQRHKLFHDIGRAVAVGVCGIALGMRLEDVIHHGQTETAHQFTIEEQVSVSHSVTKPMEVGKQKTGLFIREFDDGIMVQRDATTDAVVV